MSIHTVTNHIDFYRINAEKAGSIEKLSGRTRPEWTEFISRRILENISLSKNHVLLDIGCGDGTLLSLASSSILRGVGVVPTEEEKTRLVKTYQHGNLSFMTGDSRDLPLPNTSVDRIVCNAVFPLFDSDQDVRKTFSEIHRILKAEGIAYVGEVPVRKEIPEVMLRRKESLTNWIFAGHGFNLKIVSRRLSSAVKHLLLKEPLILCPKDFFYIEQTRFNEIAGAAGLKVNAKMISRPCGVETAPNYDARMDFILSRRN